MCRGAAGRILGGMQSSTTTIHLELRLEDDSLSGHAVNGNGRREFTGWIGLLAAIDELIGAETNESTPRRST